ncbi:rRNA maturation RNase YbeY [bacterium]|nr:rRNA maturation RNase YbeY [bacterium]
MINLSIENEYKKWLPDENKIIEITNKIFDFYMSCSEISKNSCLSGYEYETIAFDILFTDGVQTHIINRDYRRKDYPADIITFALFADSTPEERFVQEFEINLGEIIIALDKITEEAEKKGIGKDIELIFMISHGILHLLGFDHQTEDEFQFVVDHQKLALENIGIKYDKI